MYVPSLPNCHVFRYIRKGRINVYLLEEHSLPFLSWQETLAQQFNFTYRYIDDALSLKDTEFAEYLELIYQRKLETKETTETAASSSYLDRYLYINNGKLTTRLYD